MPLWPILAVGALIAVIAVLQYRARRGIHRPLASRQPERQVSEVPLGMEALDLDAVSRTNRRNESLERGQTNWLGKAGFFGRTDTDVAPLADDETYAARFHDAFQKNRSKDHHHE
ncbi:hypothetical protein Z946_365 [Sulfitobacter noctilucicola]|uniref:Uncharacterized protein n=1 Tax=Sulfitobacter noctilucicola TaxID=1342301 RepID=A0A7W6Q5G0_9RHOB|nr:hypothetical protein [Sulfitobacter noctilucicola]KIN66353.1 hypothetical protein Z946_365 [Sulfitobacter noctilucicola]MBB4175703.1 hypothetical protein [Sulfitobacter noctilucicola]